MAPPVAMGFRLGVDGWTAAAQRLRICPRRPATPNSRWRPAGDAFRWRFLLAFDIRRRACDAVPWVDSSIISVAQNETQNKILRIRIKLFPNWRMAPELICGAWVGPLYRSTTPYTHYFNAQRTLQMQEKMTSDIHRYKMCHLARFRTCSPYCIIGEQLKSKTSRILYLIGNSPTARLAI